MAEFNYTALSPDGQEIKGQLTAADESEAMEQLKSGGHFLLKIEEARDAAQGAGELSLEGLQAALQPAKKKHTPLMFRQLSVLLDSGVSLIRALAILEEQAGPLGVQRMVRAIRLKVESGENLSTALMDFPHIFSSYVVNMMRAAELSGEMEVTMSRVADQLENAAEFKRQLITGFIYPGLIIIASVGVISFLTLWVIPRFEAFLGEGTSLPWATQTIMDISAWMQENWSTLFGSVGAAIVGMFLLRKTKEGAYFIDSALLRVPVIGSVIRCGIVVNFSRNLSMLFASGVPLVDGLDTVRNTIKNGAAAMVIDSMKERILLGESMSAPLSGAHHVFPSMVGEMVKTGEETGEVVKVLDLTADIFQKMLASNVKRMSAMVEPLIISILGGLVLFVFYGLITGMLAVYGI